MSGWPLILLEARFICGMADELVAGLRMCDFAPAGACLAEEEAATATPDEEGFTSLRIRMSDWTKLSMSPSLGSETASSESETSSIRGCGMSAVCFLGPGERRRCSSC